MTRRFYSGSWHRVQYTVNPADPTVVVRWSRGPKRWERAARWRVRVTLTGSWGVEAEVFWLGLRWWSYDHWLWRRVFDRLERKDAHLEQLGDEPGDFYGHE